MRILSTLPLVLLPSLAHASGDSILNLLWVEALLLFIVFVILVLIKLPIKSKLIVFSIYLVTNAGILFSVSGIPYQKNFWFIITLCSLAPVLITSIFGYRLYKNANT